MLLSMPSAARIPAVPDERYATMRRSALLLMFSLAALLVPIGSVVSTTSSAEAACAPRIKSLTAAQTTIVSGTSTRMTVLLTCAPRSRKNVFLKSDHQPNIYPSATFVTVKARHRTATFTLYTNYRPTTVRAKVQARLERTSRWVASTPLIRASAEACNVKAIITPHLVYAGPAASGTVSLTCVLDVPKTVYLELDPASGSNQVPSFFHVPTSVTVPAKRSSAPFPISFGTSAHPQFASVRLKGSGKILGDIQFYPGLSLLSVESVAPDVGMRQLRVGVYTRYPAPRNFVVRLSSSSPRYSLPPTVTIPEGTTGAQVVSVAVPAPELDEPVTATASPQGSTQELTQEALVLR
ncbi:hypothetical protein ACFX43_10345 [Nocardioides sp. YIM B13467]|uniref:hypothetical protein n=1 Tax=Nocardioides sp. YIM B13467 TaxID=3366294 RepID=UPI00367289B2